MCNETLKEKKKEYNIVIVSGGARGADKAGEMYANEEKFDLEIFPADWKKFGKSAGFRRNEQMANVADAVVAFWDGKSNGTKHMIETAEKNNLDLRVINYGNK